MRMSAIRILAPFLFLATGIAWLMGGTAWMPLWMVNIGSRGGLSEVATTQLVVGILIAEGASIALLGGNRWIGGQFARIALIAYSFVCVATIASVMARSDTDGGFWPFLGPVIGLICSFGLTALQSRRVKVPEEFASRGSIWTGAVMLAICVLSIGIVARIPIEATRTPTKGTSGTDTVILDYVQWQGRTLPDTGLSRLLPILTARTLEGRSIVVLYSPECGHCRELFEQYFTVAKPDIKVIAVEIPPAPGTIALSGDNLGPVPCEGCERLSLPVGRTYVLKPPTVLVVDAGRVVCATDSDWKTCLGEPTSQP